jgi:peptidyl-prolyl cis-trans isomerase C
MSRRLATLARTAIVLLALLGASFAMVRAASPPAKGAVKSGAKTTRASARAPSDSVLVRLGKETITSGMVQRRIEELPENLRGQFSTPEGRQRLLDRMVEEKVWLLAATRKGVPARPEIQKQIEQQRRDLLIRTYINEVMATVPAPSDSEIKAYYDEHLTDYKMPASVTISHIQLKTEAEAKRVRQMARNGQDWGKLVSKYSADTLTRGHGGALPPTSREGLLGNLGRQPAIAETAFTIGKGHIGGPIKTEYGWHVIRVDDLKPESSREFDQVRAAIARQLGSKRSQDFYQAKLAEAKADLGVRADSGAIHAYLAKKKTAREAFNEAQSAGAPQARIDAYRKVVEEYPDSDVSPQAAFMVGFIQSEELKDYDAATKSFQTVLSRYPKSELAASARWMLDHMRSENAPEFMNLEGDSSQVDSTHRAAPHTSPPPKGARQGARKP